jgi:hypothetical protein
MTTEIELESTGVGDHRWFRLWQGYQRFYRVEIAPEVTEETFRRLLDLAEPMWAAIAWRGDEALGLVHYIRHRSTWTTGDYCYLQDSMSRKRRVGSGSGGVSSSMSNAEAAAMAARASIG